METATKTGNFETVLDVVIPIKLEKCDLQSNGNKNERPERNLWREIEIITMLEICKQKNIITLLSDKSLRSENIFQMIETEMFNRRFRKKNYQQIWTKWKFLKSTYTTSKRKNVISKVISLKCYELLDQILNADAGNEYTDNENSFDVTNGSFESNGSCFGNTATTNDGNGNSNSAVDVFGTSDGTNIGTTPIISNVQGGLNSASSGTTNNNNCMTDEQQNLNPNDMTNFGMQHPIFGYRLGIIKSEPIDEDETSINEEPMNSAFEREASESPMYFPVQAEISSSSPHTIPPLPPLHMAPNLPTTTRNSPLKVPSKVMSINLSKKKSSKTKNVNRLLQKTTKPQLPRVMQIPPIPKLKQFPLVKINIPKKSEIPEEIDQPKVPPLRICKRKNRDEHKAKGKIKVINKETLGTVEFVNQSTNPNHKILNIIDSRNEPGPKLSNCQTTYGRAIRELAINLKEMQKELLTDFFKKQAELVEEEHRFQRQQDEILLKSFEEQTNLLLNGARTMLSAHFPMAPNVLYFDSNNHFDSQND